jgi:hypothetical protein
LTSVPPLAQSSAQIAELRARLELELDALAAERRASRTRAAKSMHRRFTFRTTACRTEPCWKSSRASTSRRIPDWLGPRRTALATRRASGRLRIGVILRAYLYRHSIGRTTRGLVAMLDRQRFELTAIFVPPVERDDIRARDRGGCGALGRAADQARSGARGGRAARARCAVLQDIGMDPFTYFLAFARLAPVQCVSFGHPDTTAFRTLTGDIAERFEPHAAEQHYSERFGAYRRLALSRITTIRPAVSSRRPAKSSGCHRAYASTPARRRCSSCTRLRCARRRNPARRRRWAPGVDRAWARGLARNPHGAPAQQHAGRR